MNGIASPPTGSRSLPLAAIFQRARLTGEASATFKHRQGLLSVTFSPGSAAGPRPCASPAGPPIEKSGQDLAPASLSPMQESAREPRTRAICGPTSAALSPSAALQQSLESRLRARLAVDGSPEYVLTWKHWDMPSGPPICALRARARPISDNDCSGWPTPTKSDTTGAGHAAQGGFNLR